MLYLILGSSQKPSVNDIALSIFHCSLGLSGPDVELPFDSLSLCPRVRLFLLCILKRLCENYLFRPVRSSLAISMLTT
jgi:hypothetical protein